MSEYITVWQAGVAGLGLVIGSTLYSFGGRSGKWKRRWIASFILSLTVNLICVWRGMWSAWFLLTFPLLSIGFHLGYGADFVFQKVIKRTIYAVTVCLAGVVMAVVLKGNALWVLIPHFGVGAFTVFLGVKNPVEAAAEEFFICLFLCAGLMMYPFAVY